MFSLFRSSAIESGSDWYHQASAEDRKEYDAFGPWVCTIGSLVDMPKVFRPWYEENKAAAFLFKLPVDAERRAMRPGMDLYRAVVAVHEQMLVVLTWNGTAVDRIALAFSAVKAIRSYRNLLQSELSLLLADGQTIRLEYSAVSSDLMEKVICFLREHIAAGGGLRSVAPIENGCDGGEIADHFYRYLWKKHASLRPSTQILHWEAPGQRCRDLRGRRRLGLGCMVLNVAGYVIVVSRSRFVRRWYDTVYSQEETFIPLQSIRPGELALAPPEFKSSAHVVTMSIGGHQISLELFSPVDKLMRFLGAVAAQ